MLCGDLCIVWGCVCPWIGKYQRLIMLEIREVFSWQLRKDSKWTVVKYSNGKSAAKWFFWFWNFLLETLQKMVIIPFKPESIKQTSRHYTKQRVNKDMLDGQQGGWISNHFHWWIRYRKTLLSASATWSMGKYLKTEISKTISRRYNQSVYKYRLIYNYTGTQDVCMPEHMLSCHA